MAKNQLDILYRFEKEKEAKAAQQLQAAELEYRQNLERLKGVGEYRLEYMRRLSERSKAGVESSVFNHFHAFVNKLDQAGEQVKIAINQSKALMEKRKQQWLSQHQKVQAVEHLREIQLKKVALAEMRKEQRMFDEIATQQFIRRNQ